MGMASTDAPAGGIEAERVGERDVDGGIAFERGIGIDQGDEAPVDDEAVPFGSMQSVELRRGAEARRAKHPRMRW